VLHPTDCARAYRPRGEEAGPGWAPLCFGDMPALAGPFWVVVFVIVDSKKMFRGKKY